jgi:Peptidase family M1 domain
LPTRVWEEQGTEGAYGEWLCADVVCHEIAHQWFGNMVTCANWAEITSKNPYSALASSWDFFFKLRLFQLHERWGGEEEQQA